jgi:hypothetical protein
MKKLIEKLSIEMEREIVVKEKTAVILLGIVIAIYTLTVIIAWDMFVRTAQAGGLL